MPEVRHASNFSAQSDPVLPSSTTPEQPDEPSPTHLPSSSHSPARRPLQKSQTKSTDNVPVKEPPPSSPRRLSLAIPSHSHHHYHHPNSNAASPSSAISGHRRSSFFQTTSEPPLPPNYVPRRSLSYALRSQAPVYYDSRASTHREYQRRERTLSQYYDSNPDLLPQLPFTWHHGYRRWKLWTFAFLVFIDASAVPIALYYGMKYAGHVQEWIIFAVVTTIWGGPTYLEFAIRTLRLLREERFYRPLGATSRWCADMLTWASTLTITVVTALFIVGSAPHDTWLRVVAMAAPSILWCLGGVLLVITLFHRFNLRAPFRISSTGKGEKVLPGVFYFIEDILAVNAGCGRPYREALMARYRASPRFRQMLYTQSIFWSVPSLILATALTVIAVIPQVPEDWSYGVCWLAPFLWAFIWGLITIKWCKRCMVRERLEWEAGEVPGKSISPVRSPVLPPA